VSAELGAPSERKARAKQVAGLVVDPIARFLLRLHISPDAVTITGTIGAVVGALWLGHLGHLLAAVLVVTAFALADMLDGSMARQSGRTGPWGAFLDSTLDRFTDAAIFGALILWYLGGEGDDRVLGVLALYCLVGGQVVSYARARAESLGMQAAGGIAERTERLVVVGLSTALADLGVPYAQAVGLWLLVVAISITVLQRMLMVRRQAMLLADAEREGGAR
jgi:CDP-diacylglycerol--glycerol-3-phosphate 3-phosphatidyltransferase